MLRWCHGIESLTTQTWTAGSSALEMEMEIELTCHAASFEPEKCIYKVKPFPHDQIYACYYVFFE